MTEITGEPRTKRPLLAVGIAVVAVAAVAGFLVARGRQSAPSDASSFPARTVTVGSIEVEVQPVTLDASGARFRVRLTTHSGDLGMTPRGRLQVGGKAWEGGAWTGDPAGGHHRVGEIAFARGGPARGTATLTIEGLAESVVVDWEV